ncbi:MAG TPA: alpha-glucosidase/alpha-galactosidase [Clostridia bacterium]|nr:alpha-glucosidase/alpha-galactosidase [Clostridia bacterium]
MKNVNIAYIGGGSKNWAQKYFSDLLLQDKLGGVIRLYDIDVKAAKLNEKYYAKMVVDNKDTIKSTWECVVESDIDKALTGADIVLISILPYSLHNMRYDVHYAEKYGIYQPVGDTVGPGGYSRALRTLSAFKFFGEKIKENCPDAWVINYTNPMSMCVNALFASFPEIKAFGCCHEVFSSQKLICGVLDMYNALDADGQKAFLASDFKGVKAALARSGKKFTDYKHPKTDRHEIYTNVQGINHFTFINEATFKGEDVMPIYKAFVPMFKANRRSFLKNIVKFDIFERYGVFGAAGDRHLSEFIPENYLPIGKKHYGTTGFILTTVTNRLFRDFIRRKQLSLLANSNIKIKIKPSGEEGVLQLIALNGLGDLVSNVNIPNQGQAPGLPANTAVETNAKFTDNKIEPMNAGEIENDFIRDRVTVHAENQRDYIKAFFAKDKEGLRKVFMRDPSVSRLSEDKQSKLFDELIECNKDVLEDWLLI